MIMFFGKGLEFVMEVGLGKVISGIMKRVDKAFACDNFIV